MSLAAKQRKKAASLCVFVVITSLIVIPMLRPVHHNVDGGSAGRSAAYAVPSTSPLVNSLPKAPVPLPDVILVDPPSAVPPSAFLSPDQKNCTPPKPVAVADLLRVNISICEDIGTINDLLVNFSDANPKPLHESVALEAGKIIASFPQVSPRNYPTPPTMTKQSTCVRSKLAALARSAMSLPEDSTAPSHNSNLPPKWTAEDVADAIGAARMAYNSSLLSASAALAGFAVPRSAVHSIPPGFRWIPSSIPRERKALVAVTSCCSMWPLVEESLASLFALPAEEREWFDIIVVDDYSKDGTVERVRELGIPVVSPRRNLPLGLTFLWNTAYRVFKRVGYAALILANNDVIVPPGVIKRMLALAQIYEVVAPLTTSHGAGYLAGSQGVQDIFGIGKGSGDDAVNGYINEPRNTFGASDAVRECMQDPFDARAPLRPTDDDALGRLVAATDASEMSIPWHRPLWTPFNFNGFFWAVSRRVTRLERFVGASTALFNPCNPNVGNEVEFAHRMMVRYNSSGEVGRIGLCLSCFVYHRKGQSMAITIRNRNDLRAMHGGLTCDQLGELLTRRQLICAYQKIHRHEFWGSEGCKFVRKT